MSLFGGISGMGVSPGVSPVRSCSTTQSEPHGRDARATNRAVRGESSLLLLAFGPARKSCSFLVLLLALLPPQVHADVLISTNSTWRFRKGTSEASAPTNAWRSVAFDDSSWSLGAVPFYYDTDNIYTGNTILADMQNGYTCLFL